MPIARTFDSSSGKVLTTLRDGYLDRLSRWSDIQEYLPFLHETAKSYENVRVLELGTRQGNSTLAFLAAAEEVNGHVWSADIVNAPADPEGMLPWSWRPAGLSPGKATAQEIKNPWWTFIHGDDMDSEIQGQLPGQVDVLFIDTSHLYQHTLDELRAYMPRVVPGGIALFHDTNLMMNISGKNTEIPPVREALDAYSRETGISWRELPGVYGLGIIEV
jgi:predicted O-methyltransferase YrrM